MSTRPAHEFYLSPQPTPFLGRQAEVAELSELLDNPACRLVTLAGPGGIGKTRLAIEVATRVQGRFADGVAFASLQSVPSVVFLASAIADALHLPLHGQDDPQTQLLHVLRDKQLLLLLDNFEHLLEGIGLLLDILRAAPEVVILVTSREVLNLREEWLYPVDGMDLPDAEDTVARSSAVQLFAACARRVRRDFTLEAEQAAVARICRLVAGMPLAIELAASWTKTLPCAAIAGEIARNLAFLETSLRDVPERHRSVRAVFDQSWQLLAEDERRVFGWLSVFRGGFTREAAGAVVSSEFKVLSSAQNNAELKTQNSELLTLLVALVDKSLIRRDAGGRYQVHELLRQYAESHLAVAPDMAARAQAAHSAYYLRFLSAREAAMAGGRQPEATHEIAGEIENIRAAWQWAVDHADIKAIKQAEHPLSLYYAFRGPYRDGVALLDQAVRRVRHVPAGQERDLTLARLLVDMGMRSVQLGQLAEARVAFEEAQSLYTALAVPLPPGQATDPLIGLGLVAVFGGDLAAAARYGTAARLRSESDQHSGNLPFGWFVLAVTAQSQGQIKIARRYAQQAIAAAHAAQNRWFMCACLIELTNLARLAGEYPEARQHAQAAYALREEFGDWQGMAVALYREGRVAVQQADYLEARRLFQRSLDIAQKAGDRSGCATGFYGLALVACRLGEYDLARRRYVQSLEIVVELKFVSWILGVLAGIAELLLQTGQPERAGELSVFILRHPAAFYEDNDRAQKLLLQTETALAPAVFAAAVQRGQTLSLDATLARLQLELAVFQDKETRETRDGSASISHLPSPISRLSSAGLPASLSLVEQLTRRELEVLRLIGEGLSNQAIADRLVLSYGTVRWYTQQIYGKLGVQSRTQALARARELQILA